MIGTTRWLVALLMAALLAFASVGPSMAAAQGASDTHAAVVTHVAPLSTEDDDRSVPPGQEADAEDAVSALPSTGRGSVMTGTDTHEIVTGQIVRTVLVLAAVVSIAFGALALYARQKEL